MKLWLDDKRVAPNGWHHATTVDDAIELIHIYKDNFEDASLDNDLGALSHWYGGDGYKLVEWMIEHDIWPKNKPTVHSMNPVRAQTMKQDIERYWHD